METLREEEQEFLMFQSLFYWILFFYLKLLKKYTEVTWRFNPYFTGFSSFIHARRHGQDDLQSCFNPYSIGFSSFIIWQMVCKNGERPCFNPYSIGFSSFIWAEYLRKNECTGVSILILLDSLLLSNQCGSYSCNAYEVSILILLDSLLL